MYDLLSGLAIASIAVLLARCVVSVMHEQGRRTCLICGEPLRVGGLFGWLEPPIHNPDTHPGCRPITARD